MSRDRLSGALSLLGMNLDRKPMRVLAAVISACSHEDRPATFAEVYAELLRSEEHDPGAKPLVYRMLSRLERSGLVQVDRSSYHHRYWVDRGLLTVAFHEQKYRTITINQARIKELRGQAQRISMLDPSALAQAMIAHMTNNLVERSRSAIGAAVTSKLVEEYVYSRAKSGDTIRIALSSVPMGREHLRIRVDRLKEIVSQGCRVHAILYSFHTCPPETAESLMSIRVSTAESSPLRVLYSVEPIRSYQFVALNKENMLLVVSTNPLAVVLVTHRMQPRIIEDVIERFDADFERMIHELEQDGGVPNGL